MGDDLQEHRATLHPIYHMPGNKNKDTIELPLTFNNSVLDTVTKHKHLEIEINSNLTWKDHCKTILRMLVKN